MIALITPTGARSYQFSLCAKYMQRQDYKDKVVWIIVDDALPRTTDIVTEKFKENWEIIKVYPEPSWQIGQNTQGRNLVAGLESLMKNYYKEEIDGIFIIEDDDYYRANYLTETLKKLDGYLAAGELFTIYYNVTLRRWIENKNDAWSSLFQTVFSPDVVDIFISLKDKQFIDYDFFRKIGKKNLFNTEKKLSIGMKGMPGRGGIGAGHGLINHMALDIDCVKLYELLGRDAENYLKFYE